MNKKIDIITAPFLFFQDHKNNYRQYAQDSLKGLQDDNLLSTVFFSPENIEIIQQRLIKGVFNASNKQYLIGKQSEQDLMVVMRAIYLQNATFATCTNIANQIDNLDNIVVNNLVPNIMSAVIFNREYLRTINNPIQPIDRPVNMSSSGNKSLPSTMRTY